jgi:hypothetical protein
MKKKIDRKVIDGETERWRDRVEERQRNKDRQRDRETIRQREMER